MKRLAAGVVMDKLFSGIYKFFFILRCEIFGLSILLNRNYWAPYEHLSFSEPRSAEEIQALMLSSGQADWEEWQVGMALRILEAMKLSRIRLIDRPLESAGRHWAELNATLSQALESTAENTEFHRDISSILEQGKEGVEVLCFLKLPRGRGSRGRLSALRTVLVPSM